MEGSGGQGPFGPRLVRLRARRSTTSDAGLARPERAAPRTRRRRCGRRPRTPSRRLRPRPEARRARLPGARRARLRCPRARPAPRPAAARPAGPQAPPPAAPGYGGPVPPGGWQQPAAARSPSPGSWPAGAAASARSCSTPDRVRRLRRADRARSSSACRGQRRARDHRRASSSAWPPWSPTSCYGAFFMKRAGRAQRPDARASRPWASGPCATTASRSTSARHPARVRGQGPAVRLVGSSSSTSRRCWTSCGRCGTTATGACTTWSRPPTRAARSRSC